MESIIPQTTERKMGMKGHPQSNCGGGWMKKKKMAMVAVVILVAVMGVMVVQKVRDRRLFNLVIKDKDRQIISLHLLLQKEKQYAKETKRKNQDLNAKLFSLQTDKTQLNNNILEMRSTITSMRDEQRALESTIHDLQSQIQLKQSEFKDFIQTHNQTATKNLESTNGKKHPQNGKLDVKIQNTTETKGKENGDGLTMKKKSFIEKENGGVGGDKSQVTPNWETTLLKSNNYSTGEVGNGTSSGKIAIDEEIKSKMDDEDEGETEADMNADQDYKEETQD